MACGWLLPRTPVQSDNLALGSVAKDSGERHLEARQQRRRQHICGFARQFDGVTEAVACAPVEADAIDRGIYDAVPSYADAFVEMSLDAVITPSRRLCSDFYHVLRDALLVFLLD